MTTAVSEDVNNISFTPSSEQVDLREMAHEFARNELRPRAREADARGLMPDGLLERAAAAGLTAYALPEEYGGGGLDPITSVMVAEELAWGDVSLATGIMSAQLFGGGLVAARPTPEQLRRWLPVVSRSEGAYGAIAFSEPHAGSDVAAIRTTAVRDGDEWVLNGEKTWITAGNISDALLVYARTGGEGAAGLSAFIIDPKNDPGVSAQKLSLSGLRASQTSSVFFSDTRVPADRLVGEEGDGFGLAMAFFMHSRPTVAATGVGLARAAFELAVEYANEREAFGKPIMRQQGVSFMLADMGMKIEAARGLVWKAASVAARGEDAGLIGSYAKAFATDVAMEVTTNCVQVLGGAGLSHDHPAEMYMRNAKVLQIVEGTNQIQRLICGRYYGMGVTQVP